MHLRQKFGVVHFCLVGCFFTLEKAQFLAHLDPLDGRWSLWGKCKIHDFSLGGKDPKRKRNTKTSLWKYIEGK